MSQPLGHLAQSTQVSGEAIAHIMTWSVVLGLLPRQPPTQRKKTGAGQSDTRRLGAQQPRKLPVIGCRCGF